MVSTVYETGARFAYRHALELDKDRVREVYRTLTEMLAHVPAREYSDVECSLTIWTRRDEDVPTNELVDGPTEDARYTFGLRARRVGGSKLLTVVSVLFEKSELSPRGLDVEDVKLTAEGSVSREIRWRGGSVRDPLRIALYFLREYDLDSSWSVKKAVDRAWRELKEVLGGRGDRRSEVEGWVTGYDGILERWLRARGEWVEVQLIRRIQGLEGRFSLYGVRARFPASSSLQRHEE